MLQNEFYHDLIDSLAAALDAKDFLYCWSFYTSW